MVYISEGSCTHVRGRFDSQEIIFQTFRKLTFKIDRNIIKYEKYNLLY